MARAKRILTDTWPYHITARCINREWFSIPLVEVWKIFNNHLFFVAHSFEARIHAFVLMSNHFHLLMSTPQANVDQVMLYLMTATSRQISERADRINQTYGGPYFSSLIRGFHSYCHAYKYVYRNPVEAGLVLNVEDYPHSTLNGLLGKAPLAIPMSCDDLLFDDPQQTLAWLNTSYKDDHKIQIRHALRSRIFTLARRRSTRKPSCLESERS